MVQVRKDVRALEEAVRADDSYLRIWTTYNELEREAILRRALDQAPDPGFDTDAWRRARQAADARQEAALQLAGLGRRVAQEPPRRTRRVAPAPAAPPPAAASR